MLNQRLCPCAPFASEAMGAGGDVPGGPRAVLDPTALARLAELDPKGENGLIERVLQTFRSSATRLSGELVTARRNGSREAIRLVVHTFRSSAGYIGATALVAICTQVEIALKNGLDTAELGGDLDAVNAALEATLNAIAAREAGKS